jgi:competence protein ComEC
MNNDPHIRRLSHNPLFQLACAFAVGIVFATHAQIKPAYLFICLLLPTLAALSTAYFARLQIAGFALLVAVFFAGCCLTSLELRTPSSRLKNLIDHGLVTRGEAVELTGVVVGPVELARDGIHFSLRVENLNTKTWSMRCWGVVALNGYFRDGVAGEDYRRLGLQSQSRITVRTKLDRTEQYRNPGVSTLAEYLDTKDIDAIADVRGPNSIAQANEPNRRSLAELLYRWRDFLQKQIDSHFSVETAGVLAAALLGNRYNLSNATAERFREGGTFHILVISGAHISFLGALVLLFVRRLTTRRWLQVAASTAVVWLYTVAVGADVSVVRAAFMFSFLALGHFLFRIASPLNSLGAASLVLLVWSPKDLFDPSLQLTFLSVLAIIGIGWPVLKKVSDIGSWRPSRLTPYPPQCARWLRAFSELLYWSENDWQQEQKKRSHGYRLFKTPVAQWLEQHHLQRILRYLWAAVVVSGSVQLMLLPLQIVYFHRLSVSSLILNAVVGILLAILAAIAFAALLIAQISASVAAPLIVLANALDWLMTHSVDPFTRLGIASLRLPEYSGGWRIVYIFYYVPLIAFVVLLAQWKPLIRSRKQKQGRTWVGTLIRSVNPTPCSCLLLLLLMCTLLVSHPFSAKSKTGKLRIDFLDVGQGDSALITMPDGATLLVDGGGRPQFLKDSSQGRRRGIGEIVVCEYLWYRGLDSVDYVLATHADADHIDGLNDVVRNLRVRSALVGRTPSNDPAFVEFAQTVNLRGTAVQSIHAGDVLKFGDVEIDVLWPPAATSDAPSRNNDSVVLRVRFGERTVLMTGDIEKSTEELLSNAPVQADVVKVPHHGSRTSSTEAFVSAVRPRVAVISVGRTSMFGHPQPEVVERWKAIGAQVLTTGRSGMITVTTDGKNLMAEQFVKE